MLEWAAISSQPGIKPASPLAPALQAGSLLRSCHGSSLTILGPMINNFPGDISSGPVVKNPPANARDTGWITGPGRPHILWGN